MSVALKELVFGFEAKAWTWDAYKTLYRSKDIANLKKVWQGAMGYKYMCILVSPKLIIIKSYFFLKLEEKKKS